MDTKLEAVRAELLAEIERLKRIIAAIDEQSAPLPVKKRTQSAEARARCHTTGLRIWNCSA